MYQVREGIIWPISTDSNSAENYEQQLTSEQQQLIQASFQILGIQNQLPDSFMNLPLLQNDITVQQAQKVASQFIFSAAAQILDVQFLQALRLKFLDTAFAFVEHGTLCQYVYDILPHATLSKSALVNLVLKYLDPSLELGDDLLVFRLFAYRNLHVIENEAQRFAYALMWALCDLKQFISYFKQDYQADAINYVKIELLIRIKGYTSNTTQAAQIDDSYIAVFNQSQHAQFTILGLQFSTGLIQIGDRWYFPFFQTILAFRHQNHCFSEEYLQILINEGQSIAFSIRAFDQMLGRASSVLVPFSSRDYIPQTSFVFTHRAVDIAKFFQPNLQALATNFFIENSLPFIDIISLVNCYGDPTMEFELPGLDFVKQLESQVEKGFTDRISLPNPADNYKNLGKYLQILALTQLQADTQLRIIDLFDRLAIFAENQRQSHLNQFLLDIQNKRILIGTTPAFFGLQFIQAFMVTSSMFFGIPMQQLASNLLCFLVTPCQESLFTLLQPFQPSFYTSHKDSFYNQEIQDFSRIVYFNILHQLISHCDDLHSLFSLFSLHIDFDRTSAQCKHAFYLMKSRYFELKKPKPLPKNGTEIDIFVCTHICTFMMGEQSDLMEVGALILKTQAQSLLNKMPSLAAAVISQYIYGVQINKQLIESMFFKQEFPIQGDQLGEILRQCVSNQSADKKVLLVKNLYFSQACAQRFSPNAVRMFLDAFECTAQNFVLLKMLLPIHLQSSAKFQNILIMCENAKIYQDWFFDDYLPPWQYKMKSGTIKKWLLWKQLKQEDMALFAQGLCDLGLSDPNGQTSQQ